MHARQISRYNINEVDSAVLHYILIYLIRNVIYIYTQQRTFLGKNRIPANGTQMCKFLVNYSIFSKKINTSL